MLDLERYATAVARDPRVPVVGLGVHAGGQTHSVVVGSADDSQFRVASLTKPFVAELALQFASDGLLSLEAPALPSAPTVRHLLAHEGGVEPDLAQMERFGVGSGALAAAVREVLNRPRRFAAGRAWEYANSGYWIIADVLARAAGAEFEEVFERHLLHPLNLADTGWLGERLLPGHDERGRPVAASAYPRARRPSGGLVSRIQDIVRFGVAALDWRRDFRNDPRRPTLFGTRSALGWQIDPAGRVAYHAGDYGGFCARLIIAPADGVVVAVIANAITARQPIRQLSETLLRDQSIPSASKARRAATAFGAYARLVSARTASRCVTMPSYRKF